jgi:Protein of unknown function (DUF3040)
VALSEEERKQLHDLEEYLGSAEPRLAQELRNGLAARSVKVHFRALVETLALTVGLLILLLGVALDLVVVGAIGFVMMGAGCYAATLHGDLRLRSPGTNGG